MSADRLTDALATRVLGWKVAPGRYVKLNRSWTPAWRFAPLSNLDQAFELLDKAEATFSLTTDATGILEAEVRVDDATGKASGPLKAKVITMALARALGMEVDDDLF